MAFTRVHTLRCYAERVEKRGLYSRCFAWAMSRARAASGPNLGYFAPGVRWIRVEPNVHMHPYLRLEARRLGLNIELHAGAGERLPLGDESADPVVSTHVLCSVSDPALALAEVLRVLRPGGRLVFLEHVAAPRGSRTRLAQDLALLV